jgi:hypothetical protein
MNRCWWRDFDALVEPIQEDHPGSGRNLKWTLIAMGDMASDDGFCWPAVETVAKKASLGKRAVQMALRQAEVLGIIRRRQRRDASTQYVFVLDALPHVDRPVRVKERGPLDAFEEEPDLFGTGAGDAPLGKERVHGVRGTGAGDSLTGAPHAPRNTNETPLNHQETPDDLLCRFVTESWGGLASLFPELADFGALTDGRARAIVKRTAEFAGPRPSQEARIGVWETIFDQIQNSKLLVGESTDWQITSDWMLKKANFRKIMEKKYGRGSDRRGTAGRQDRSAVEAGHSALELVRDHRERSSRVHQPSV